MKRGILMAMGAVALAGSTLLQAAPAPVAGTAVTDRGRIVFDRACAPCHGTGLGDDGSPMLPGTAALAARYDGQVPAALERRTDIDEDVLRMIARSGLGAMPSFRPTEVSDEDFEAMAAWIRAGAPRP